MRKNFLSNLQSRAAVVAALLVAPFVAQAEPSTDWSTLTDAIDFGTLATGLLTAGAAMIGVYLAIKGVRIIISLVKGG